MSTGDAAPADVLTPLASEPHAQETVVPGPNDAPIDAEKPDATTEPRLDDQPTPHAEGFPLNLETSNSV